MKNHFFAKKQQHTHTKKIIKLLGIHLLIQNLEKFVGKFYAPAKYHFSHGLYYSIQPFGKVNNFFLMVVTDSPLFMLLSHRLVRICQHLFKKISSGRYVLENNIQLNCSGKINGYSLRDTETFSHRGHFGILVSLTKTIRKQILTRFDRIFTRNKGLFLGKTCLPPPSPTTFIFGMVSIDGM